MLLIDPSGQLLRVSWRKSNTSRAWYGLCFNLGNLIVDGVHTRRGLPTCPDCWEYILHAFAVELGALEFEKVQRQG